MKVKLLCIIGASMLAPIVLGCILGGFVGLGYLMTNFQVLRIIAIIFVCIVLSVLLGVLWYAFYTSCREYWTDKEANEDNK